MKPNIVALVPMKDHSERVPGKNYRSFNGRPLFHWILEVLIFCPSISAVYINTDSSIIKEQVSILGDKVKIIDRPENLRSDYVPMNEILLYDVSLVPADYYLQTHATNPLLKSQTIEKAIADLLNSNKHDSLFSVTRIQSRLWDSSGKALNHDPDKLQRTQDLAPVYEENSNLYIFGAATLRERKNRIGYRPMMFEMPKEEAIDIDEESDFKIAENLYKMRCANES